MELPKYEEDSIHKYIEHTAFSLLYSEKFNNPDWVAWELTAEEVQGTLNRTNDFRGDPLVAPLHRVEGYDYQKTGYDRGHMCPAADNKWSEVAMTECFYMSNMCPQSPRLNRYWWERTEEACRKWANSEGAIYIVCGPVYSTDSIRTIGNEVKIAIPDGFFKVVLSTRPKHEKAIGFYFDNVDKKRTLDEAARSVNFIEEITGFDFFPMLNDSIEVEIEAKCDLQKWDK